MSDKRVSEMTDDEICAMAGVQQVPSKPSPRVFRWDWRAQPDMAAIAATVTEMSAGGRVFMREIETGGDNYAWVVSSTELTDQQAWLLYLGEDE